MFLHQAWCSALKNRFTMCTRNMDLICFRIFSALNRLYHWQHNNIHKSCKFMQDMYMYGLTIAAIDTM